jgi:hypothetical protein
MTTRLDIIIKNREQKRCVLLDVATPANRNVIQNKAENKLKCRNYYNHKRKCTEYHT